MRPVFAVVLVVVLSLTPTFARALPPDPAGVVKNTAGKVVIVRNGQTIKATPSTLLFEGDVVQTGFNGRAGLILGDDTVISMGRRSRLLLDKYMFQATEKNPSLIVKLLRGTATFISGRIAKLAPDAMRIETPDATIGVRGSHTLVEVD